MDYPLMFGPDASAGDKVKGMMHEAIEKAARNPDVILANAINCYKVREMADRQDYEGIGKYVAGIIDAQRLMMRDGLTEMEY